MKIQSTAAAALFSALLLSAQEAKKSGLPKDWSMHHIVFSNPGTAAQAIQKGTYDRWLKVTQDPRYILQQDLRAAATAGPSLPAPPAATENSSGADDRLSSSATGPLPRGLTKSLIPPTGTEAVPPPGKHRRIHKDWSEGEGTGGTTGLGEFPATFTQTGSACSTDYAVYNTGLAGSASQASLVAFNNIYASCNGGIPTVYFAYNTGATTIVNSIDLSKDGTQLAFIQGNSGSAATLKVLKWSHSGGSVSAPTTPTSVATGSYQACTAPCYTSITFSGSTSDTYSSPFYDYASDTLYAGDDTGKLHKFTGVFLATPAEVTTGGWPATVSSGPSPLGSPVYDTVSGKVFVGDYIASSSIFSCAPVSSTVAGSCGFLYAVSSAGTVTASHQLDDQFGIVDSPIVDPTTEEVYAFVGDDGSAACSSGPCDAVFQFPATFTSGATGTEAQAGSGSEFMLSGAFDNAYFTTGTGHLYVVGGTGNQNNTLYQIAISPSGFGTVTTGPAVAANFTNGYNAAGLQVTEFYTGTHDYIFLGVLMASSSTTVGQVAGYDVTGGTITTGTTATGAIATQGGSSGIVVDNSLSTAQNIYYSSLLNATCTTSGSGGCAVQVIQSAP